MVVLMLMDDGYSTMNNVVVIHSIYDCDGNIECGSEMIDSYGDITDGCIQVNVIEGSYPEECFFTDLSNRGSDASGQELISGGAPFTGEFNCDEPIIGCTNPDALNYNADAEVDDGSCEFAPVADSQTIDLPVGWYTFSTYIQPENPAMDVVLAPVYNSLIIAKDGEGLAYLPNFDFNGIGDLNNGQGYMIKLSAANDLTISGTKLLPQAYQMELNAGWNMFAYLRDSSGNLEQMLAPILNEIVIVKTFDGTAYLPEWDYNGIGDLISGEGYQAKLNSSVTFYYPGN